METVRYCLKRNNGNMVARQEFSMASNFKVKNFSANFAKDSAGPIIRCHHISPLAF